MNAAILLFKNLRLPLAAGAFFLACLAACALPMQAFAGTIEDLTSGLSRSSLTVTALPAPGSSASDLDALVAGLGLEKRDAPPGSLGVSVAVPDGSTVEQVVAALEASPLVSEAFAPALPDAERAAALYAAAQDDPTAARELEGKVAGVDYEPGKLLVGFTDSVGHREILDALTAWNLVPDRLGDWLLGDRAVSVHVPDGVSLERAAGLLRSYDFVRYAEVNLIFPLDDPDPLENSIQPAPSVEKIDDESWRTVSDKTSTEARLLSDGKPLPNTGDFPLPTIVFVAGFAMMSVAFSILRRGYTGNCR